MKNLLFSLLAISLLGSLTACNKDGDSDNTYFEFKLDGADFKASGLLAYATNFSDYFAIYGVKDQTSGETCYISLPKGTTAGTYDLDDSDHSGYYVNASSEAFSTNWGASSGTVTIEEIDETHVKGTFQFTAYDSGTESVKRVISEGKFNVKFR